MISLLVRKTKTAKKKERPKPEIPQTLATEPPRKDKELPKEEQKKVPTPVKTESKYIEPNVVKEKEPPIQDVGEACTGVLTHV